MQLNTEIFHIYPVLLPQHQQHQILRISDIQLFKQRTISTDHRIRCTVEWKTDLIFQK
ncbi:Uncharacterised protein [Vibrio cholerae]|nr:Uncharacterised protein [Vibrio cholerae]CSI81959.1 Uncharacterised protein [Vibrio cholerae]